MLDFPFQPQLAIAIAERPRKLRFQMDEAFDLFTHVRQFVLEHGLHFGTSVMLLPQRQQFLNFVQREPQFLGVPHEYEVMNLLSVEQAISARAAIRTPEESEFLIEADRVHANAGQLRCLTDVNGLRHK